MVAALLFVALACLVDCNPELERCEKEVLALEDELIKVLEKQGGPGEISNPSKEEAEINKKLYYKRWECHYIERYLAYEERYKFSATI